MSFGELLDSFQHMPVVVVGDVMLDEYHFGRATRISPEAPVMVIRHQRSAHVPGGAANVALNMRALGASPTLIGVAGDDEAGSLLAESLAASGLEHSRLIRAKGRPTTRKTRIVADHSHQVLRMDWEEDGELDGAAEAVLHDAVRDAVRQAAVVVLSDYLKGALTSSVSRAAIDAARANGVPVVVNPKPRTLSQYEGATLVSLNRSEAAEALGRHQGLQSEDALEAACQIRSEGGFGSVLITLGEAGMAAAGDKRIRVEAPKVEVYDTAGAGDTVIATVALGLAAIGFEEEVFRLAAQTSASVVRHVGVATPSEADLAELRHQG